MFKSLQTTVRYINCIYAPSNGGKSAAICCIYVNGRRLYIGCPFFSLRYK